MFDYRDAVPAAVGRLGSRAGRHPGDVPARVEQLSAAGYRYIGLGKFVLPHDDLAMAQEIGALHHDLCGYSLHGDCDHLGFGVGAVSRVGGLFCQNADRVPAYQRALDQASCPAFAACMPITSIRCTVCCSSACSAPSRWISMP